MLSRLSVRNLAIIESAEIEFGGGLNIITGETGAGKSVLMKSLELALGARADSSAVRDGAKDARIDAEFILSSGTLEHISPILDELDLPACEDGVLIIRRTLSASGGGRVYVNDSSATVQTLRRLGVYLADIHGPHDHQTLLEETCQRAILDSFARVNDGENAPASVYTGAWRKLVSLRAERQRLSGDSENVAEEIERLRYSVDELEAADLSEEDETELPLRHAEAAHAADIIACANDVTSALSDGDEASAAAALISAGGRLAEMSRYHEAARGWRDELEELIVRVQELSRSVADSVSRIDADPEVLQALDERLSLIQKLKRKYACQTAGDLITLAETRAARLADLESRDAKLASLGGEIESAERDVREAGAVLTKVRRVAAEKLAAAITGELRGLGFLKAGFGIALAPCEADASGCDAVEFLFEPNPGEAARPLCDIASTGETARVMLAVKSVVSEHDSTPTLVFDEIDSNIGGEVGRAVGGRMRRVAEHHQVIAITHLPQSAVFGEHHFVVAKNVSGGRTRTSIHLLTGDERVAEISRMLGGDSTTGVVTRHARELLENAM